MSSLHRHPQAELHDGVASWPLMTRMLGLGLILPTGYSLDDMEPQIEAAYELEDSGIDPARIVLVFCRAKGSDSEGKAARAYLHKARMNVLAPIFPELASIRQGHAEGRAASEVPFPRVQEKVIDLAQDIVNRLLAQREAA